MAAGPILALETSCDETALAVFDPARGLIAEWVHSQVAAHEPHGGVVPELAAREHLRHLPLLLHRWRESGGAPPERVAVTRGPGLAPCLALGVAAAKALALSWRVPVVGINHLRAHAYSPFIALHAEAPAEFSRRLEQMLPHLGLLVSGGHTLLFALEAGGRLSLLASTRDDAAGEALDKGAKLLGLGYPGGPLIEARAAGGRDGAFDFPRARAGEDGRDFSFSGLKTSLRYRLEKMTPAEVAARTGDLAASYQRAAVDALARRVRDELAGGRWRSLGLSGGVARNGPLRAALAAEAGQAGAAFLPVAPDHAGDNAGMIAFAAWFESEAGPNPGMGLEIEPGLGLGQV